jgi:hypothetical protein
MEVNIRIADRVHYRINRIPLPVASLLTQLVPSIAVVALINTIHQLI